MKMSSGFLESWKKRSYRIIQKEKVQAIRNEIEKVGLMEKKVII